MIKFALFGIVPEYNPEYGRIPTAIWNQPQKVINQYIQDRVMVA